MPDTAAGKPQHGRLIELTARDGGRFQAYLSTPEQGSGPGLVLLHEVFGVNDAMKRTADLFAEEGYVVIVPDLFWRIEPGVSLGYSEAEVARALAFLERFDAGQAIEDVAAAIDALRALPQMKGRVGAVGYCLGGTLAYLTAARTPIDCAVGYYGVNIDQRLDEADAIACPLVLHFADGDQLCPPETARAIAARLSGKPGRRIHHYPEVGHAFALPGRDSYHRPSAMMAHTRTLALLREVLGPIYDLETYWEQHVAYEFVERDVPKTMTTMVNEPYVNHIPTLAGGVGKDKLARFYKYHFVDSNPADTRMIPISRTIGVDRLVDEMIFCFTHDREIDWMLPGVPPTGKYVEVPLVAIVNFRGGKLYHEHIYWDQASVLVQIGLLDAQGLPVAGIEAARKVIDESLPSNGLMTNWHTSEGKPI